MASKLFIFLAVCVAVQSTAAAPAPGISDWFTQVGKILEGFYNVKKNMTQHAIEGAEKTWQSMVDVAQQEAQEVASWIQNAYNASTTAWSSIQGKLQDATQKAVSSAQQALISAGQQISQEASQLVQEAAANLQSAVSSIPSKTQEAFQTAMQFVERGEAALQQLQQAKANAASAVIQSITKSLQQGLQNVRSLLNKASAEVNKSTS
ncbi:uncharacterized protein LOC124596392 [Schistocerca americana]|uniref:uncharacterized protein LOC124596392 n=1 Tax=Schistocerca americana TaxID=7009 RepID=UPI001F500D8D|nr:uncharacterized protein LOC124596392 [Schistocerca americana]XP_047109443.1 uncharacterized protein LOC124777934 [Schistocerca piceifrons]XP_049802206.1 uncharacterized protein LOC126236725 [Schistocerca nitens]